MSKKSKGSRREKERERKKERKKRERDKEERKEEKNNEFSGHYVCHAARLQRHMGSARTSLGPIFDDHKWLIYYKK